MKSASTTFAAASVALILGLAAGSRLFDSPAAAQIGGVAGAARYQASAYSSVTAGNVHHGCYVIDTMTGQMWHARLGSNKAEKVIAEPLTAKFNPSEKHFVAKLADEIEGKKDGKREQDDADGKEDEGEEAEENELSIPLESVPAHVRAAAEKAREGVKLSEAEVESVLVYEFEGTVGGKEFEIEVTSEGDVIGVEADDDEK